MTLANNSKLILNTLLVTASFTSMMHSAHAASPNAAPFGIEIGVSSCDDLRTRFGSPNESKLGDGDVWLVAKNANALYAGATKIGARCSNNKVIAIQLEASKGGLGNDSSREIYSTLKSKYKLVAGGPMPSVGNGYARFAAGASIIEQDAPHMSFEFTLTYYEKGFYDSIVASNAKEKQQAKERKQAAL